MPRAITLVRIEKEIEGLSRKDQIELVERLAHKLKRTGTRAKKARNWTSLYGLGKGLWDGEDGQDYVNRLREERI